MFGKCDYLFLTKYEYDANTAAPPVPSKMNSRSAYTMHNQMCHFEIISKGTALYCEHKIVKIEYMMLHEVCILIDIEKNTRCDILT